MLIMNLAILNLIMMGILHYSKRHGGNALQFFEDTLNMDTEELISLEIAGPHNHQYDPGILYAYNKCLSCNKDAREARNCQRPFQNALFTP